MTPEQRLDRLERIAGLMVRSGLRARRPDREQDEKINMIIDAQMKSGERFHAQIRERDEKFDAQMRERDEKFDAQMRERDERFGVLEGKVEFVIEAQIRNEERFAKLAQTQTELTESHVATNRRLEALIEIVIEQRNGGAH
ncbi:MAG TPA: hypothetical protein VGJ55_03575 [Pyrinomonadaceae bacterium]|jgi:hypothetical protein